MFEGLLYVEDQSPQTDFRVLDRTWNLFAVLVVEEKEVVNRNIKLILQRRLSQFRLKRRASVILTICVPYAASKLRYAVGGCVTNF